MCTKDAMLCTTPHLCISCVCALLVHGGMMLPKVEGLDCPPFLLGSVNTTTNPSQYFQSK